VTDHPRARLAYLTNPNPGVFLLNTQLPGQEGVTRVEITINQLRGFIVEGASMAFKSSPNDIMKDFLREKEKAVSIEQRS
jgi:hypothetical protein